MTQPATAAAVDVTPSARRLTGSLRDVGYDFTAAVADLVDNAVAAGARRVEVEVEHRLTGSYVVIADDGLGMSPAELNEALRFGTRRSYGPGELGRYGLGLKTASISQGRRLTVATRRSPQQRRIAVRTLDLDHVAAVDRWEIIPPPEGSVAQRTLHWLNDHTGTVVVWENLDRVLPEHRPQGGWARRRLELLAGRTAEYLGMVFHRFIEDEAGMGYPLSIAVNGTKVRAWNPFAPYEERRLVLSEQIFEVEVGRCHGDVVLHRYVLPPREAFSSRAEFERLSGPLKWNRQQGFYIYRANRLIQGGGWSGLRAPDEHTKFARASIDFGTELDELFRINIAKMRVTLPPQVRTLLERPVQELSHAAEAVYRRSESPEVDARRAPEGGLPIPAPNSTPTPQAGYDSDGIGPALLCAALEIGEHAALSRILDRLSVTDPQAASALGWSTAVPD